MLREPSYKASYNIKFQSNKFDYSIIKMFHIENKSPKESSRERSNEIFIYKRSTDY